MLPLFSVVREWSVKQLLLVVCWNCRFFSAMEAQFQAELDEAPYLAKLGSVLGFSLRFPHGPAQVGEKRTLHSNQIEASPENSCGKFWPRGWRRRSLDESSSSSHTGPIFAAKDFHNTKDRTSSALSNSMFRSSSSSLADGHLCVIDLRGWKRPHTCP